MIGGRAVRFAVTSSSPPRWRSPPVRGRAASSRHPEEPAPPPPPPRAVERGTGEGGRARRAGGRSRSIARAWRASTRTEPRPSRAASRRRSSPSSAGDRRVAAAAGARRGVLRSDVAAGRPHAARGPPGVALSDLPISGGSGPLDLTVLTTTAGVLAIGCPAGDECTKHIDAAGVRARPRSSRPLPLALALRLPTVVERLDSNRRRTAPRSARGPRTGARGASPGG